MKSNKLRLTFITFFVLTFATLLNGCGSSKDENENSTPIVRLPNGATLPELSGPNVLKLTVNGTTCSANSYPNKPCIHIQLCAPNSDTQCQTLTDVLVDTGSYGLRVFKSAIDSNILSSFTPVTSGSGQLAECVHFGDGSKDWGPVYNAGIILGGEPVVTVPIQVIDSTYASGSTSCSNSDTGPADAGFKAILGVGVFEEDCGSACIASANNGLYYTCSGSTCTKTTAILSKQVANPIPRLPSDNNGVILELPSIPFGGVQSIEGGYMVLGIDTDRGNNSSKGMTVYAANPNTGVFTTEFAGKQYTSFIDSGSNGYFMPAALNECSSYSGWYCPTSIQSLTATTIAYGGAISGLVEFFLGNISSLFSSGNDVFLEIGGNGGTIFDWGLPFYIGRNVFLGFENKSSSALGATGPYWAY